MSGPPVFLGLDQAALDRAYDQRAWAADPDGVMARLAERGAEARARLRPECHRYGPGPEEVLDLFRAGPGAPVHLHLHGGAWRALSRLDASFLAPALVSAGVTLAVPDLAKLPAVRMPEMAAQAARSVAWAAGLGGRLTLSGHSSGAHLAAVVATGGGGTLPPPPGALRGLLLVSGAYDLAPVLLSARRAYVSLDEAEARALSPARHLDRLSCPVALAVGDRESPEFRRHAEALHAGLSALGRPAGWVEERDCDHFEIWERLGDPGTALGRAALDLALGA